MYCSSCGGSVIRGLSYCNHCGAKIAGGKADERRQSETFLESLIWAMVSVFIVGTGCLIGLMAVMKEVLGFPNGLIMIVVFLSFLLMFVIEGVFIWQLISRRKNNKEADDTEPLLKEQAAKELYTAPARVLTDQPIPSVTDHTTRTLEPVLREQESNKAE